LYFVLNFFQNSFKILSAPGKRSINQDRYCLPDKGNVRKMPEYFIKSPFLNIIKAESEKKKGGIFFLP